MHRRQFLLAAAAAISAGAARAYDFDLAPPTSSREAFVDWMTANRHENARFLGARYDRYLQLLSHKDIWDARDIRAYLMTPREEFVTAANLDQAYEWHHLNIGFGVTITGPHTVARMT